MLAEIKRSYGDVWVELGTANAGEGREFVDRLLENEPNRLTADFRDALFERTSGHPLFTIELLRMLEDQGDLVKDTEGNWVASPALDWDGLPARVEGVIEERLSRLDEAQRELLRSASIEGVNFIAEVISKLQQVPLRALLRELSQNLERRHRLVRETGELKAGKQALTSYQFAHALFQHYLYTNTGTGERRLLHGEVADALEALYGDDTAEVSAQLAWHYDQAGETDKAIDYLIQAGERATAQGASLEAHKFFSRSLELLPAGDHSRRWRALRGRLELFFACGDYEACWAGTGALLHVAEELSDQGLKSEALRLRAFCERRLSKFRAALSTAEEAVEAAKEAGSRSLELRAEGAKMLPLIRLGEMSAASELKERLLSEAQALGDERILVDILLEATLFFTGSGDYGRAADLFPQAISLSHRLAFQSFQTSEETLRNNFGDLLTKLGLLDEARRQLEQAMQLAQAGGDRRGRAFALNNLGMVYFLNGDSQRAREMCQEALNELTATRYAWGEVGAYKYLGRIAEQAGDWDSAMSNFSASRDRFITMGCR